ncbi:large conductance mechanosensitive channel protein MscL [Leptolyngbya sp. FACHB-711]|jgi:large conductance mechanosensitive channel|uniref:large conductance mechanosensitive channel protein MscL n=1 Tax=unclassified Leptolyngbya TaxID=2650499 RepID=UPI00168A12A5|nr:large conductance mechanosensitive channel protein MscL [Leptolyngbya sp. FACHB-711]MBD1850191.1 large conductance mechanosensitive channel protein MscL [Cyanobacteria bacterium FACHB-502]MBD2027716.1 large conductance mechanosensitive channel protein MscL [Leptolyngbya sp. FACHB-711]
MAVRRGRRAATGFLADFREFVMRGNVLDLAVAVVVGAAFSQIVDSFVKDIITPLLLNPALQAANLQDINQLQINGIKYGVFLAAVLNFLIISFVLFLVIQSFEAAKRRFLREEEVAEDLVDPIIASQQDLKASIDTLTQTLRSR